MLLIILSYLQTNCDNHIDEVCVTITKTIDRNIQNTLNTLEKDAQKISSLFHDKLNNDRLEREREGGREGGERGGRGERLRIVLVLFLC